MVPSHALATASPICSTLAYTAGIACRLGAKTLTTSFIRVANVISVPHLGVWASSLRLCRNYQLKYCITKESRYEGAILFYFLSSPNSEPIQCRLSLEIFCRLMSLGHSASQAYVLVQLPKPNSSILETIFRTRSAASTLPCGNKAK